MRCQSTAGKICLAVSVFFVLTALLVPFTTDANWLDGMLGLLMFAALAGLPGWLLCSRDNRQRQDVDQQLKGFIRSRDSFYMPDLAEAVGLHEIVTRRKVLKLIQNDSLDLIYDSDADCYIRRSKITEQQIIEECPSCGSKIAASKYIGHQDVNCPYCGNSLPQESNH